MVQRCMTFAAKWKVALVAGLAIMAAIAIWLWWLWDYMPGRSIIWSARLPADIEEVLPDAGWQNFYAVDFNNMLYCLDASGRQRWRAEDLPGRAQAAHLELSSAGGVFAVTGAVRVDSYSAAGQHLWQFSSKTDWLATPASKPVSGYAEIGVCDSYHVYGLNLDGKVAWVYDGYQPDDSHRTLHRASNGEFYFVDTDAGLNVLNADGSLKWHYQLEYDTAGLDCFTEQAGSYYIVAYDNSHKCGRVINAVLSCLNSDGELVWNARELYSDFIPPVVTSGALYLALQDDGLISYSLDGVERWRTKPGLVLPPLYAINPTEDICFDVAYTDRWNDLRYGSNALTEFVVNAYYFITRADDRTSNFEIAADGTTVSVRRMPAGYWIKRGGGPNGLILERGPHNQLLLTRWTD